MRHSFYNPAVVSEEITRPFPSIAPDADQPFQQTRLQNSKLSTVPFIRTDLYTFVNTGKDNEVQKKVQIHCVLEVGMAGFTQRNFFWFHI